MFVLFYFFSSETNCQTQYAIVCAVPNPKHKHTAVIFGGMPPALQVIVWFAGLVTYYWRIIVVHGLTQRSRPRVISMNRGIVTPSYLFYQLFFGKTSSGMSGTQWEIYKVSLTEGYYYETCIIIIVINGSQLPLGVTTRKLGHQQGLLNSFYRCYSTQPSLSYHCSKLGHADAHFYM